MFKQIKNFISSATNYKYYCVDYMYRDLIVVAFFFISYFSFLFGDSSWSLFCLGFGLVCYHLYGYIIYRSKKLDEYRQ